MISAMEKIDSSYRKSVFDILFVEKPRNVKGNYKYTSQFDYLKRPYHKLFDKIDWELKLNNPVNEKINEAVNLKEILNFDIKNHFVKFEGNNKVFDEAKLESARKFFAEWPSRKLEVEKQVARINNKKYFKSFFKNKLIKLSTELCDGDYNYNKYKKIFDLEKSAEVLDREKAGRRVEELELSINETIEGVIGKYLEPVLEKNPEIIIFNKVFNGKHEITTSAFLRNEFNENLVKYFNSEVLSKKLDECCEKYIAQYRESLETPASEEQENEANKAQKGQE